MSHIAALPNRLSVTFDGFILTFIVPAPNGCNLNCPFCYINGCSGAERGNISDYLGAFDIAVSYPWLLLVGVAVIIAAALILWLRRPILASLIISTGVLADRLGTWAFVLHAKFGFNNNHIEMLGGSISETGNANLYALSFWSASLLAYLWDRRK